MLTQRLSYDCLPGTVQEEHGTAVCGSNGATGQQVAVVSS